MKKLNSKEVINKLRNENVILSHGYKGGWLSYKDEGGCISEFSERVFQNLIIKDKIKVERRGFGVCSHITYYDLNIN